MQDECARWESLWMDLGCRSGAERTFAALVGRYAEEHRAYHTFQHVRDCLIQFDQARHLAERPLEVEIALWFHDVVYDPRSTDNEEQSARWATRDLQDGGAPEKVVSRVAELILATRHAAVPGGADAALIVDVDLSILGRCPSEFDVYEQQIRQEYSWVPPAAFCQGRADVLRQFAEREFIYHTPFFRNRYEEQARDNLHRSLRRLASQ